MKNGIATDWSALADTPPRTGRRAAASGARGLLTTAFAAAGVEVDGPAPWDIQVRNPRFFSRVVAGGSLAFGESYMDGDWECAAIDELCCRLVRAQVRGQMGGRVRDAWTVLLARLVNFQSMRRARRAVTHHYDLGNEFFAAMLDPELQYSCAYFVGTNDLAEAQRRKLDLICRKLGLQPGMRVLDVGCGWGGLARHAARHFGCEVVGITLSPAQRDYADSRREGLPVEFRLQDYREVGGTFDRVASVGMMEHVGHKNYAPYMTAVAARLRPGGLFLCHTIGNTASKVSSDPWLTRYIFPGSLLPSVAQVARAAERHFVVEDVHNFGAHYDLTLGAWERNFSAAWPRFRARYGERFGRMWRYYLLSCAGAFRARAIQLNQFVLAKGGVPGGYTAVR